MPFYALESIAYVVPIVILVLLHQRLKHKERK